MNSFEQNGYQSIENFMTPVEIAALKSQARKLVDEFDPEDEQSIFHSFFNGGVKSKNDYILDSADKIHFFLEEKCLDSKGKLLASKHNSICKIGHALHDRDPVFDSFSRSKKIEQLSLELGFRKPLIAQSMYFFKNPFVGGEIGLHQDATFIYTTPSSVVGFWFALEDATVENSCLWVLPEGHHSPLTSQFIRHDSHMTFEHFDHPEFDLKDFVPLEVKAGTLIALHGHLPHYSQENKSSKSREAYTLHLIEGNYPYPPENWLKRPTDFPFQGF